ncbi:hypothetical protein HPC49_28835 [Pyxidicoccus fallax]|uniref:Uncharacterized protein n=1 Tax=Pyxidicoccus fallax TaxID=394095 RepID=A0A848L5H9_9BACT|nr:hypothetical protein [Pyxidicoccus fallax]NMO14210.1 hypothetical protein [Pyxidicoccus fallax]NPC82211.1 hypothetical protein [Pyxidicoccus fallax]
MSNVGMATAGLSDLDELALRVRDADSKVLFLEAVQAYRAGAYRSAVTSVWIAVVFDTISKLRELNLSGDKNAATFVKNLEKAIEQKEIRSLQDIERTILDVAESQFELLGPHERSDLERLQSDRNLCAHPALLADGQIFQPTPELVRTHLVHVATHLLRHPPVQGKAALTQLLAEIGRPSFPSDQQRVHEVVSEKLRRAKDVLVRNLVVVLLKNLMSATEAPPSIGSTAAINVLSAISRTHAAIYQREVQAALGGWIDGLEDDKFIAIIRLSGVDSQVWAWMKPAARVRVVEILSKHPVDALAKAGAFDALSISELRPQLLDRFQSLPVDEKQAVMSENPRPEFADEAISLFSRARGFRTAESLGEGIILPLARHFSADQVTRILEAAKENVQIWHASEMPSIFERLFDATRPTLAQTVDAWSDFVRSMIKANPHHDWYHYTGVQEKMRLAGHPMSA